MRGHQIKDLPEYTGILAGQLKQLFASGDLKRRYIRIDGRVTSKPIVIEADLDEYFLSLPTERSSEDD